MKRPFAVIGITYLIAQAVAAYLGSAFALMAAILLVLTAFIYRAFFENRNVIVLTVLISAFIAMLMSFAYSKLYIEKSVPVEGETAYIKGQMVEEPSEQYGRYYYIIKTDKIDVDGVPQKIKIRLSSSASIEAEYSDNFEGEICFTDIGDENSYFSKKRMLSKGIIASAYLPEDSFYNLTEGKNGIYSFAISVRKQLKRVIYDLYPDETADIIIAMITGDEGNVDYEVLSAFRNTGASHILAVSGLHLSLLALAVTWLLRRFLINRKIIAIIVCIISWFYVAVAGFPMSSVRSAIMITVMLLGIIVDRLHSPLNSLGIAVLIICVANPYASIDVGLLMSFSSTLGLISAAPELNRYIQRKIFKNKSGNLIGVLRKIVSLLVYSFTASVFILPVSVLCFGKVAIISPLVNLIVIPIAELFLGIGMIAAFLGLFGGFGKLLAYPFMTADWAVGKLMLSITDMFDSIPGTVLNTGENTVLPVFGCILIAVLWALIYARSRNRKHSFAMAVCCCVTIAFVWFFSGYIFTDSKTVTIYDVGNANMILVRDRQSAIMVGAGGNSYDVSLAQYDMADNGISKLSAIILTDMSESAASGAETIINTMEPNEVYIHGTGFYSDTINYCSERNAIEIYDPMNLAVSSGAASVFTLKDTEGKIWNKIQCGRISVVVCPEGGNALYCPFGYDFDAVIMSKEIPSCISALNAKSYIVSAEYKEGVILVNQLMARGLRNVYCTGVNGNIELAVREGRLYIGGDHI